MSLYSHELLSTRRWAIDSDGVARLVEIWPVVKVVLLAMCFLVFALCLVGCNSRWDLSLSDHDPLLFGTSNQVQLSIYRFTFQVFCPKVVFGFTQALRRFSANRSGIYCCVTHGCGSKDIREFKIRRLRTTATDKYATTHDQNHVTVHFSRVVLRLRWVVELFRVVGTTENILLVFCRLGNSRISSFRKRVFNTLALSEREAKYVSCV